MGYIYTKSGKLAKRLYFGAVLLFEGLYYTFKNRVLADGGTFVENELPTISQDASLVLTPNAYKAGKLYSAVPNDGTGDFTVDRNCPATYVDEDGLIKTALANVPRIIYSTGDAALLVEPQSTNLVLNSNPQTYGGSTNITISNDTILGQLALRVINNSSSVNRASSASDRVETPTLNISLLVNDYITYSFSIINNNIEGSIIDIWLFGVSPNSFRTQISYDFVNDVVLNPILTNVSELFTKSVLINGVYIVYFSIKSLVDSTISSMNFTPYNAGGDFTFGLPQIELGSSPTSYIPTAGVTETRLADNITVPTPAGVTSITKTIDGVEQAPITTIPATYSLPVGNINKVTML